MLWKIFSRNPSRDPPEIIPATLVITPRIAPGISQRNPQGTLAVNLSEISSSIPLGVIEGCFPDFFFA